MFYSFAEKNMPPPSDESNSNQMLWSPWETIKSDIADLIWKKKRAPNDYDWLGKYKYKNSRYI